MSNSKRNLVNSDSLATNSEKVMHLPGSIIDDRYQIIQKLGRSGREKTYLAKDLERMGDGKCVVEQLSFERENEANWQIIKQYLLNEIAVLQRLGDHAQIPQLYNYFTQDQQFYLIREYIDGDNLEQEVENKPFDEAATIYLIQDSLRILDFVHKTNVIHRDVRPAHLIRRKQDNAYVLINFGAISEIEATEINLQGELILERSVSNWVYSAPEQKRGESNFSSDLYALGRSAIYALTGKSPQELEQTNVDWRELCQISDRLEAILDKMMSPTLEERYHSALEILQNLLPLLKLGQLVGGRYRITNYLGGNQGVETYLADNLRRQYQSPCLIKQITLPQQDERDKMQLERRFAEELSVLERLGYHEQIPQLWDHFEENDEFYLVQAYIQGENLALKIARQDLTVTQTIQILDSTLSVLQFVHQNRIIHRNIKPANLIVRELDRQVILTDFGILHEIKARVDHREKKYPNCQDYWSPEQIAGRPNISSDLYAVGMTAIEALTGQSPTSLRREETGKLLWQSDLSLDRRLVRIIDRLVELDLGQRYQSAEKVLYDLRKIGSYSRLNLPRLSFSRGSQANRSAKSLTVPLLVGLLGIACLFGSIEFAFPRVRPWYYRERGNKLLNTDPQAALEVFDRAIDLKAQNWHSWLGRGDALAALEQYPPALAAYTKAAELNPSEADIWHRRGNILLYQENFSAAITAYDQAIARDTENGEIYYLKGEALLQLQQYEAALQAQSAALERSRLDARFLSGRGQSLLQLGRYDEALGFFNRVQAIEPDNLALWQDKFLVLSALDRPQEAKRVQREISNHYVRQIQQQPQDESIALAQGDFFTAAQMFAKAVSAYDGAIVLKSDYYAAWVGKGKALAALDKFTQATAALEQARQISPESYRVWQALGGVSSKQNDYLEAIANYDRALAINSEIPSVWRDRGIALQKLGQYLPAIESLTKASELTNYDRQTWQQLAQARVSIGQNTLAIATIDRGLGYYSQDSELWHLKGKIQTQNGQYNQACDTYRRARRENAGTTAIMNSMRQLGCRLN
ncbi:MAG: tetratricopeptide repeat protein [Cyanobacteria bacterium J06623_7]